MSQSLHKTNVLQEVEIIGIRYRRTQQALNDERSLDAYLASGVYESTAVSTTYTEPQMNEAKRTDDEPTNLGIFGGIVAQTVAQARQVGKGVLMSGGDCTHITGVVGGLQMAHGPECRIGLVWFDAHGDFNTPKTSLSGMLGGMPVAVCAGLAFPSWRQSSGIVAPLPSERILMVDVRHLDEAEEQLIRATDIEIARIGNGMQGDVELKTAVAQLANHCDLLYFHIDSDILDERYVPNHGTREPNGPSMEQVCAAIDTVMATGKVAAFAVVSVYGKGEGAETSQASGIQLIEAGLKAWKRYGLPNVE